MAYNENQLTLIQNGTENVVFNEYYGDYIVCSIYNDNNSYVTSLFSNRAVDSNWPLTYPENGVNPVDANGTERIPQISIYRDSLGNVFAKPNEILETNLLETGNYNLKFSFHRDVLPEVVAQTTDDGFDCTDLPCPDGSEWYVQAILGDNDPENYTCAHFEEYGCDQLYDMTARYSCAENMGGESNPFTSCCVCGGGSSQPIYGTIEYLNPRFYINQISPSRRELRLYGVRDVDLAGEDLDITQGGYTEPIPFTQDNFQPEWNSLLLNGMVDPTDGVYKEEGYLYDHVLITGTDQWTDLTYNPYTSSEIIIPINNFLFDNSSPDNPSLIIKINNPLPTSIFELLNTKIAKKILSDISIDILYESNITLTEIGSDPLEADTSFENLVSPSGTPDPWEDLDDLVYTASLSEENQSQIDYEKDFEDINLNVDFGDFKNHVFFGSAEEKIINFNTKVKEIEGYLSELSSSLTTTGSNTNLSSRRKELFGKISNVKSTFTPYERYLYYDQNNENSSSVPGHGKNIFSNDFINDQHGSKLFNYEGFNYVLKGTGDETGTTGETKELKIFNNNDISKPPFFNDSGSYYLSFLMRGQNVRPFNENINGSTDSPYIHVPSRAHNASWIVPRRTRINEIAKVPDNTITGSEWRRLIIQASQSYWRPVKNSENDTVGDIAQISSWIASSKEYEILSGSNVVSASATGSIGDGFAYGIKDTSGQYGDLLHPQVYSSSMSEELTLPDSPRSGSVLPSGPLFNISWNYVVGNSVSSSYITDIKLTKNNPIDTLPFSSIYRTGSTEYQNWYQGTLASASAYDSTNIHSLKNNLPQFYVDDSDEEDLLKFVNMLGEKYDVMRNYITNFSKMYKRKYDEVQAPPTNLLPILADNLGWELVNPFTGSLFDYYSNLSQGATLREIQDETWNKVLNNLIYLYKSKGTRNSVDALLNVYGYPTNAIKVKEYASINEAQNPEILNQDSNPMKDGLSRRDGNVSYIRRRKNIYSLILDGTKKLNLDWFENDATGSTIEFLFKTSKTKNNQTLLASSGSGAKGSEGKITILSPTGSHFDGDTVILSSSDGTGKTYIFDDDNGGATGTLDGTKVRVQLYNRTGSGEIAMELSKSIASPNGHNGKIQISDIQYFSASNGAFYTNTSQSFALSTVGVLNLTQATGSNDGNTTITSSVSSSYLTVEGFLGGTDSQHFWDLRLVPSSNYKSGSLQFRLNNSVSGSDSLSDNAYSMSTAYLPEIYNGQLWNVMLQRMTSSLSPNISQSYKITTGLQNGTKITHYETSSMTVWGSRDNNSGSNANSNFTGSSHTSLGNNLLVGQEFTGSVAMIRFWDSVLSQSKFKQHILNKFSIIGNTVDESRNQLNYNFKLQENHKFYTGSSRNIIDSAIHTKDYTEELLLSGSNQGSNLYSVNPIETVTLSPRNSSKRETDNKILTEPKRTMTSNLSPQRGAFIDIYNPLRKHRTMANYIEIITSVTELLDEYISNLLADMDISTNFASWSDLYEQNYKNLDALRDSVYKGWKINLDKFLDSQENTFNDDIVGSITSVLPERSKGSSTVGVLLEPTVLERSKIKYHKSGIQVNPNLFEATKEILGDMTDSEYLKYHNGKLYHGHLSSSFSTGSEYIKPYVDTIYDTTGSWTAEKTTYYSFIIDKLSQYDLSNTTYVESYLSNDISLDDRYELSSTKITPYEDTINYTSSYALTTEYVLPSEATINKLSHYDLGDTKYLQPYTDTIPVTASYDISADYASMKPYEDRIYVTGSIVGTAEYTPTYIDDIPVSQSINVSSKYSSPHNSSIYDIIGESLQIGAEYSLTEGYDGQIQFTQITRNGNFEDSTAARLSFTYSSVSGSKNAQITLESYDGTTKTYCSTTTGSLGSTAVTLDNINGIVSSSNEVQATATFTFIESGSDFQDITLESVDGTRKTYRAMETGSLGSGSAASKTKFGPNFNGEVSGSFVLFMTGSTSSSMASNLRDAINSSNGHGASNLTVLQGTLPSTSGSGKLTIKQVSGGKSGNSKEIIANTKFKLSTNPDPPSTFSDGVDAGSFVLFKTGSNASSASTIDNLFAAISSSNGHGSKFTLSKTGISPVSTTFIAHITQSKVGTIGNTTVTANTAFKNNLTSPLADSFAFGTDGSVRHEESPQIVVSTEFESVFEESIGIVERIVNTAEKTSPIPVTLDIPTISYSLSGSQYYVPYEGTTGEIGGYGRYDTGSGKVGSPLGTYINPLTHWGTTLNDTHIVNMEAPGGDGYFNTAHWDEEHLIYTIGDFEYVSSSLKVLSDKSFQIDIPTNEYYEMESNNGYGTNPIYYIWPPPLYHTDYEDGDYFTSPLIIDKGKGYTYQYKNTIPLSGRPIGRTSFFTSDSDGNITYPINHYKYFPTSKQELDVVIYKGSLNGIATDCVDDLGNIISCRQGVGYFPNGLDLFPTSASYTVEVPDEWSEENEY